MPTASSQYAGRVGTGWSTAVASAAVERAGEDRGPRSRPSAKPLPAGAEKDVVWVEPRLVCEIEFSDWTHDDVVRQASFKGLRDDKPPGEIVLEAQRRNVWQRTPPKPDGIRLTHPERILWPEEGITKQGLADFYTDIADWILPHIAGRVLSLVRCPSGTGEKCFFAKHGWAGLSDAVTKVDVGDKEPMLTIGDLKGLLDLVQAGVVEIHPWGSRHEQLWRNPTV